MKKNYWFSISKKKKKKRFFDIPHPKVKYLVPWGWHILYICVTLNLVMSSTIYKNTHYLCRNYAYTANFMDETEDYPLSMHSFTVFLNILDIQSINNFFHFLFSVIWYSNFWLYYNGVHLFTSKHYFAFSFKYN